MNTRAALWFASLVSSGCISASGVGTRSVHVVHPDPSPQRGDLIAAGPERPIYPARSFLAAWGPPSEIVRNEAAAEEWRYYFGLRWQGIWGFFTVLPYGFFFPVGCNSVTLTVEDGQVVAATRTEGGVETWHWCLGFPCECLESCLDSVARKTEFDGVPFVED